jgi:RNA polymerase sigma-70 factor (ECF subfamily)
MDFSGLSVTALLTRWRDGEAGALDQLTALVYDQLRQIARGRMSREQPGHTLTATALAHEAFLRVSRLELPVHDRGHFLALAAREMRRVLVDHARKQNTSKRGGQDWTDVSFTDIDVAAPAHSDPADVIAVQQVLERLEAVDPRKVQIIDLMVFGGLTVPETAEALGVSDTTIHREWRMSKAWLQHELKAVRP